MTVHYIPTLAPYDDEYEVIKPFCVIVQPYEDEFRADFLEAGLSAFGATPNEAIENLKAIIADSVADLDRHKNARLGRGLMKQRVFLEAFIRKGLRAGSEGKIAQTPVILVEVQTIESRKTLAASIIYEIEITTLLSQYDPEKSDGANHEHAADEARIAAGMRAGLVGIRISDTLTLWRAREQNE
jgi:hypothetical protein